MSTRLVSVIIPCYNQARYLPVALESVRAQTYACWECIIVDDGSTDATSDVGARLAAVDTRVRCVRQENRGLAGARNRGLDEARGDFIQFLDADDLLRPEKLATQLRLLEECDMPGVAYCDYSMCEEDPGIETGTGGPLAKLDLQRPLRDLALRWENGLTIPCHAFLFDARLFRSPAIRFDESLPNHEDWECWMRLFARKPEVFRVDQRLVLYRRHGNAMSRNAAKMREGWLAALRKQYRLHHNDEDLRTLLSRRIRAVERQARIERGEPSPLMAGLGEALASLLRHVLPADTVERLRRFVRREPRLEGPAVECLLDGRAGHRVANVLRRVLPESTVRRIRRFVRRNPEL